MQVTHDQPRVISPNEAPPRHASAIAGREWLALALILLACTGLRVAQAWKFDTIADDGRKYIRMAQQWCQDPAGMVRQNDYAPGYPAVVATVHKLAGAQDTFESWRTTGIAVSLVASVLATVAAWYWCRQAIGWQAAAGAALLFGLGRKWSRLGADVLSDSLSICLMTWSFVIGYRAAQCIQHRPRHGLGLMAICAVLGGLGYFVRPEAAAAPCLVALMLVGGLLRRGRWQTAVLTVTISVVAVVGLAIPYMLMIGDVSKKKRMADLLNPSWLWETGLHGLGLLAQQVSEAMHGLPFGLLCIWMLAMPICLCTGSKATTERLRPASPTGAWMLLVTLCWSALLLALLRTAGYMSHRHAMFLAIVLLPLVGHGLTIVSDGLRALLHRLHLPAPSPLALAVVLAVGLAANSLGIPFTLRGLLP